MTQSFLDSASCHTSLYHLLMQRSLSPTYIATYSCLTNASQRALIDSWSVLDPAVLLYVTKRCQAMVGAIIYAYLTYHSKPIPSIPCQPHFDATSLAASCYKDWRLRNRVILLRAFWLMTLYTDYVLLHGLANYWSRGPYQAPLHRSFDAGIQQKEPTNGTSTQPIIKAMKNDGEPRLSVENEYRVVFMPILSIVTSQ